MKIWKITKEIIYLHCNQENRKMKTTDEILILLKSYKPTALKRYGINILGLFGSVARGEQTENSDIDVYYDGAVPSLLTLDKVQMELEQLFNNKVDMVRMRPNMNAMLKSRIQQEGLHV